MNGRWWAALVIAGGGCAVESRAPFSDTCLSDADCSREQACVAEACSSAEARWRLDAEIRPSPESPFVPFQRLGVELSNRQIWQLDLPSSVVHETTVTDASGRPIDADVAFRPMGGLSDRPLDLVHSIRGGQMTRVPLPTGSYEIRILPVDPPGPVVEVSNFIVAPGAGLRQKELVVPTRYRQLSGTVRNRVALREVLSEVEIRAVGVESGLESTSDVSRVDGSYVLTLPETTETSFRVTATLPDELQPSWQFQEVVLVPVRGDREKDIVIDIPSEAVRGFVGLEVLGLAGNGAEPVVSARVTLTASVAGNISGRSYVLTGTTDADGLVRAGNTTDLPLLRGQYVVRVEPPTDSDYRSTELSLDLSDVGNGVRVEKQVTLEARPRLRGRILSSDGGPEAFATLTFEAIDGTGRAFVATTDENGAYSLRLDPDTYLISILSRSNLSTYSAPTAVRVVTVVGSVAVLSVEDIQLSSPVPIRVQLRSEISSAPLADIDVSLYETVGRARRRVARGVSGPNGELELLLTP